MDLDCIFYPVAVAEVHGDGINCTHLFSDSHIGKYLHLQVLPADVWAVSTDTSTACRKSRPSTAIFLGILQLAYVAEVMVPSTAMILDILQHNANIKCKMTYQVYGC